MSYDLTNEEFLRDPAPALARMAEGPPVFATRLPLVGNVWVATTDETVRSLLKDTDRFVRNTGTIKGRKGRAQWWWLPPFLRVLMQNVSQVDGAEHTRLRAAVVQPFTKSQIATLEPAMERIADRLLDEMPRDGEVNLVRHYAKPLPLLAVCEMLGVPEADRAQLARWIGPSTRTSGFWSFVVAMPGLWRTVRYFRREVAAIAVTPRAGLIGDLTAARADGNGLSDDEIVTMVIALFVAGHETTLLLITAALERLLTDPDMRARVLADPEMMGRFVEETMRTASPVMYTNLHFVTEDTELGGQALRRGDKVIPLLLAANRSPERFERPDDFVADRRPNPHLGFGHGPHVCLGMHLARLEAEVALRRFLTRCPDAELAVPSADLAINHRLGLRGFVKLPVRFRR